MCWTSQIKYKNLFLFYCQVSSRLLAAISQTFWKTVSTIAQVKTFEMSKLKIDVISSFSLQTMNWMKRRFLPPLSHNLCDLFWQEVWRFCSQKITLFKPQTATYLSYFKFLFVITKKGKEKLSLAFLCLLKHTFTWHKFFQGFNIQKGIIWLIWNLIISYDKAF